MADINKIRKRQAQAEGAGDQPAPQPIRPSTRVKSADRKAVMIRLDEDAHRALKRYAFENDTSIQAITEGLLLDFLSEKR